MILPVLQNPHPLLREKTKEVQNPQDPAIMKFVQDMIETMHTEQGVGLAANQVGQSLSIIVIGIEESPLVLLNPHILRYSWRKVKSEEGCLSVKGTYVKIRRAKSIKVQAMSLEGKELLFTAKDFLATVIQHEVDHLNGILIIDRAIAHRKIPMSKSQITNNDQNTKFQTV